MKPKYLIFYIINMVAGELLRLLGSNLAIPLVGVWLTEHRNLGIQPGLGVLCDGFWAL